jgi:ectoine hydroxylase-related dioxygenase (phytanoyl-CoA dioxygenase family)
MTSNDEWYSIIAADAHLPPDAAQQLREKGFIVMPGPAIPGGCEQLSNAYDREVATADPADRYVSRNMSTTRINDFVNRGSEFDGIYVYPPLLAACCQIIGVPFKLSGMRARTLNPGAPAERLHIDVKHRADGWPLVGCLLMVDAFDAENGATRFVPGSHLQPREPSEEQEAHEEQVPACGPAGSIIIFNASAWHGHGANRSARPRRSIQAHFAPREAQAAPDDHCMRMRPETLQRISPLAKYILNV